MYIKVFHDYPNERVFSTELLQKGEKFDILLLINTRKKSRQLFNNNLTFSILNFNS